MSTIFILKFTKGHNYVKTVSTATLPFSAYCLLMLYICIKFQENISQRVSYLMSGQDLHMKIYKGA